jgi:hypothetical protein
VNMPPIEPSRRVRVRITESRRRRQTKRYGEIATEIFWWRRHRRLSTRNQENQCSLEKINRGSRVAGTSVLYHGSTRGSGQRERWNEEEDQEWAPQLDYGSTTTMVIEEYCPPKLSGELYVDSVNVKQFFHAV